MQLQARYGGDTLFLVRCDSWKTMKKCAGIKLKEEDDKKREDKIKRGEEETLKDTKDEIRNGKGPVKKLWGKITQGNEPVI